MNYKKYLEATSDVEHFRRSIVGEKKSRGMENHVHLHKSVRTELFI